MNPSLYEIFIAFLDEVFYPGYADSLDAESLNFEFNQFSQNYSN